MTVKYHARALAALALAETALEDAWSANENHDEVAAYEDLMVRIRQIACDIEGFHALANNFTD